MRRLIIAAAAALLCAPPATAQERLRVEHFNVRTTADLVRLCSTQPTDPSFTEAMGWCHGYGRGALDYHRAVKPAGADPLFCVPSPSPLWTDVLRRFIAWGNANPNAMQAPAVEGVFRFLIATYPCPRR